LSTPGKVTGGGTINLDQNNPKATFGFEIQFNQGDDAPRGNLIYQDHTNNLKLKATSFDILVIEGNHVLFTGSGTLNDGQIVYFTVEIDDSGQSDFFSIDIPALNGYTASGVLTGGNITLHK